MLMKGPEKKTAQMGGHVRLCVHWMKTSGQGVCSDVACRVVTQYIVLVREGTRCARHLLYQERNGKSLQLIEMRFPAANPA